jgi:hypothetical protein
MPLWRAAQPCLEHADTVLMPETKTRLLARIGWARQLLTATSAARPAPALLDALCARLGLSDIACEALWLLVACELDVEIARIAQTMSGTGFRGFSVPVLRDTIARAGHDLASGDLEALIDLALVETTTDPHLPTVMRWIRAADRTVELAREELRLDRRLAIVAEIRDTKPSVDLPIPAELREGVARNALVVAFGSDGSGRRSLLTNAALERAPGVLVVRCRELDRDAYTFVQQMRAIVRECCLFGVIPLLVDLESLIETRWNELDRELLRAFAGPVLGTMSRSEPLRVQRAVVQHRVAAPDRATRRRMWSAHLANAEDEVLDGAAELILSPGTIEQCAKSAASRAGSADNLTLEHVRCAITYAHDQALSGLATRIEWRGSWDDLVLPGDQFDLVVELVSRVRHRSRVLDRWGFASKLGRGTGTAALFSGPPGTGKTMVAGLIAGELGLDLYQVDLSRVVSKYIGETEKNLAALFDAAESGHAVLLFDEADALFAKRSEVKSSNDRNANLEVNYLLQRLESFRGITILTTNHETAIDAAFKRRIAVHVRFPIPDEAEREQLWRALIPEQAEVSGDLDFAGLARSFSMTGGYIKNAVVRAAYLAADESSPITQVHLARAARYEYEGMGKITHDQAA